MDKEEVKILSAILIFGTSVIIAASLYIDFAVIKSNSLHNIFSKNFDVNKLGDNKEEQQIKYGYELVTNTKKHFSGNGLSCKSCHLKSGQKAFAIPFIGLSQKFPEYIAREDRIETLADRINGCFERSLNSSKIKNDSAEMQAIIAYINWLSKDVPFYDHQIYGQGLVKIKLPNRAANLQKGKIIYRNNCASCHQANGQGQKTADKTEYIYPPLWGQNSYNNGAGMARLITAAEFIKANMPFGVDENHPLLSDEEVFDVAGYIESFKRPIKPHLEKDYPNLKYKPASCEYPPYADHFSIQQHEFGPYPTIENYYQKNFGVDNDK